MKRLSTSAPITSTCSARPPSTCAVASESADRKPVQAAPRSIAPARVRAELGGDERRGVRKDLVGRDGREQHEVEVRGVRRRPRRARAGRPPRRGVTTVSPSETLRRSWTPVRWTIHCSVTPAPSATTSLPTMRSGTAIAIEASEAARSSRGRAGARVATALVAEAALRHVRPPWLGERRLCLDAVERLADEVREHLAGAGLDEAARAGALERAHHIEPAHGARDRLHEAGGDVVEGLGGHARVDGHVRRADLGLARRSRGRARPPAPSAASGRRPPRAAAWRAPRARRAPPRPRRARRSRRTARAGPGRCRSRSTSPVASATSWIGPRSPRARTAIMPPSPVSSAASCMRRPRAATSRRPSSAEIESAATSAAISPSEWPAIRSALVLARSCSQPASAAQKIAGCAQRVPSPARSKRSSPTSLSASSSRSGRWRSTLSRMSGVWLPWPGNSSVVMDEAPMYEHFLGEGVTVTRPPNLPPAWGGPLACSGGDHPLQSAFLDQCRARCNRACAEGARGGIGRDLLRGPLPRGRRERPGAGAGDRGRR